MQEIVPGLFLGPYAAAKDYNHLKQHGITHIFMIRERSASPPPFFFVIRLAHPPPPPFTIM